MKSIKILFKNLYVKLAIAFLISLFTTLLIFYINAPRVNIFGFHAIINIQNQNDRPFLASSFKQMNYPRQNLEIFLGSLLNRKIWFLSSEELYDYFVAKSKPIPAEHIGEKPIMLSFDDGYKNNYTNLLYSLERLEEKYGKKVKVVLFINPGTLATYDSNASIHMTCNDLRDGLKKGFYDIQSHGLTHKNLTKINDQELIVELEQAQANLRKCVEGLDPEGKVAAHIAYPFGAYNGKVKKYASKYYASGYLYNSRALRLGWLRNNYEISRITVNNTHSPNKLIKMAEKSLKLKK